VAHAEQGRRTLIVDGDLRRPSVHQKFGLQPDSGFSSVLTDEATWRDLLIPIEGKPNLYLLPAGTPSHRAADLMSHRIAELLDEFSKDFDLTIVDCPPLLGFAESLQMATAVDGVLIVGKSGVTQRNALRNVLSALYRVRANVLGVVLNHVSRDSSGGHSYYGYSGTYYTARD
jgi:succinoglycan biosynthesis transport protein ExoP